MAERSTAAVDSAAGAAGAADADGADAAETRNDEGAEDTPTTEESVQDGPTAQAGDQEPDPEPHAAAPELHSGHKLAKRYRLEECVTRLDGFSSWRAVDEKLRRAVGVHLLAADHPHSQAVLDAARAAALIGDARFVQVLDAVAADDLVYVVHEWLPDATTLSTMLAGGQSLEPDEAYELIDQLAQALAAAHRKDLAHLRLTPSAVLRTGSGQWRIRGLAIIAALHGTEADDPRRTDTEAAGALLYAALTGRWPHEEDAHGLAGLPKEVGLLPPDQVRAGVHRGLSELAMRALAAGSPEALTAVHGHGGREPEPCTTPDELVAAVAEMPRIRPPESQYPQPGTYRRTAFQQGYAPGRPAGSGPGPLEPAGAAVPPALPGRTGKAVKLCVSGLLITALALGSWQLADALINHDSRAGDAGNTPAQVGGGDESGGGKPVEIAGAKDFDPYGNGEESPSSVPAAYDGDPESYWETMWYTTPVFGNLKDGVGLVVDLGKPQRVGSVKVDLVGETGVTAMATPRDTATMPTDPAGFKEFDSAGGTNLTLKPTKPVVTQYVLLWITELPPSDDGNFRGKISNISIRS